MSDKTVPADADDYQAERPADESHQDPGTEGNELAERSKTHKGETRNRDESEFTYDGLKTPDVETDIPENENRDNDN